MSYERCIAFQTCFKPSYKYSRGSFEWVTVNLDFQIFEKKFIILMEGLQFSQ